MKKIVISLLILTAIVIFRDSIYKSIITYHPIYERSTYAINSTKSSLNVYQAIDHSKELTSTTLDFDMNSSNCIHYAELFTKLCNESLPDNWIARHYVGELHVFNFNVHELFTHPGLKNHDYVIVENKTTGEKLAVDPLVHDYFRINLVTTK